MSIDHLSGFTQLPHAETEEERRSLWRQGMATLARSALEQQPVPLEGIDPRLLLLGVRSAFESNLLQDLDWLSPPAAAAAVYELAAAIPMGPERRQLGRQVLQRLYGGDAETFVVLATSLAAESRRTLTGVPIRARVALALELPIGSAVSSDGLALALLSRPDLRREWLSDPAVGSLPSRRLSARLLERAAREAARRAAQGDAGSLRAFSEPAVKTAWRLLLGDRESLVWRHVAVARGLLSRADGDLCEEIEAHLDPALSPTEWRRAAVSLAASIAVDPARALPRCRAVLSDTDLQTDAGLPGTMIFGLARAAEAEPEAAEELLRQAVRIGGFEGAEALVELRRERVAGDFGAEAARYAREKLETWLTSHRIDDDGRVALCEALIDEMSPPEERPRSLRDELDDALKAFVEEGAGAAFARAQQVFQHAIDRVTQLEQTSDGERAGRRMGFRAMRELDVALLETATLGDLLSAGAGAKGSSAATAPLGDLFQRLTTWLLRQEGPAVENGGTVDHLTLRMRRLRTLLHLVDADGSYGEDMTGQRRERRLRIARVLLARARDDAHSPLRRIVAASVARALDALVRDEICELSDVMIAVSDNVPEPKDLRTLAEASMLADFQRCASAYAELSTLTQSTPPGGRNARQALDALEELAQSLPWASTLRVSALRQALLQLARQLEAVAAARCLAELAEDTRPLTQLESTVLTLAQLTAGARRRLVPRPQRPVPAIGSAIGMLRMAIEHGVREHGVDLDEVVAPIHRTLSQELPEAVAHVARIVLGRLESLPLHDTGQLPANSFVPPAPKEAPLPPWMPGRRILGGFYVLRALGAGGVGSVFVVTRVEDRHRDNAVRFALKVPDYSAEAARTLSEDEFLTLFREEAGALLALPRHRNLATFVTFDAGAKPKPILVMELVEGPTLERVIERAELDVASAIDLLDGVGEGIGQMHRVGIGHLDVKPSNVILRPPRPGHSEHTEPVLVDFGLAGRHIRPGCATGPYGAPEIWGLIPEGQTPDPEQADVYAFACMIYETLTGNTLFDGSSELAIINSHLTHDGYPERLLALRKNPRLTAVSDLIANGLRQDPRERITIDEMRKGLRELAPALSQLSWPLRVNVAA
ncbi:MAG: serine/threonine-protein kinase [Myxococcales bacterium]|jgi:hypothetical protein